MCGRSLNAVCRIEKRLPMKLLMAVIAARAGSEEAATLVLGKHEGDRLPHRHQCPCGVSRTVSLFWRQPPEWVVELSMAVLTDNRFVTGLEKTELGDRNFLHDRHVRSTTLGVPTFQRQMQSSDAVACRTPEERLVWAVYGSPTGRNGRRFWAVPFLMEMVEAARQDGDIHKGIRPLRGSLQAGVSRSAN